MSKPTRIFSQKTTLVRSPSPLIPQSDSTYRPKSCRELITWAHCSVVACKFAFLDEAGGGIILPIRTVIATGLGNTEPLVDIFSVPQRLTGSKGT